MFVNNNLSKNDKSISKKIKNKENRRFEGKWGRVYGELQIMYEGRLPE